MGRTRSNKSFGDSAPAPKLEYEIGRCGLRGSKPTCTDFGVGQKRNVLHPTAYFCSNCSWYENEVMAGKGKRVKRNSQSYRCVSNHYDWVYPREKWTVSSNKFMTVQEIKEEERKRKREETLNARAERKRKCLAFSISVILEEEEDAQEDAAALSYAKENTKGDLAVSEDDTEVCEEIVAPPDCLSGRNVGASHDDNQPEMIKRLKEQVELLENALNRRRKSECRWKNKYEEQMLKDGVPCGSTLVECATRAIEQLMQSENQFVEICG